MKRLTQYLIASLLLSLIPLSGKAQENAFEQFRQRTGDYSAIYSGKVATAYTRAIYANHPYWETDAFRNGTLSYQGRVYTNVMLRYDLYQNILNILSEKRAAIDVDRRKVDYFILNDVRFVPETEGYRMMLHEGEHLQLNGKVKCVFGNDIIDGTSSFRNFDRKEQYTLTIDGVSYEVKKKNAFIKRFPDHKKALKRYVKEQRLDFKEHRREAFTALARYAESLIKSE